MDDSESNRSRSKREAEERTEAREGSRMEEDDDRNGSDKRKHRSSRSLKHSSQEETEEYDSGRRKKPESGKEDDYDVRRERESRSKVPRKSIDERSERRAGESYRESRDKEYESNSLRKSSGKGSGGREGSEGKSGSKLESSHERDGERERDKDKDLRYSERKETGREKDYGRQERDEERSRSERKGSDQYKHGSSREKEGDLRNELNDIRSRAVDSCGEKGGRSSNREDRRGDTEKNRGRSDARDEDRREVSTGREAIDDKQRKVRERSEDIDPNAHQYGAKSYVEKVERHRRDEVETKERSNSNVIDDDRHGRVKDRYGREVTRTNRSRSPEKGRRYHKEMDEHDRGYAESDSERNAGNKGKEREKENYRDDRSSKGKDNWEGSKDQWRRSQSRQDAKDVENSEFDQFKDWDSQRHDKERMVVGDQLYGRAGYRKDNRIRSDGLKKSSMSGAMNDNSDSIEIRPNRNLDFGREEMTSTFLGRRSDSSLQHNFNEEDWGNPKEDRFQDDNSTMESPSGRGRGQNVAMNLNRTGSGQSVNSGMHPPQNNQGRRGGRPAGGRGRQPGRDSPRVGLPLPMITPPFGPLSLPPGPLQPIGPNLTHSPNTLIPPGVFTPPFPGPLVWPGARGVDLNMLALPPNLPPIPPPGSGGSKFGPNMGADPGHPMYFNQLGSGRGVSSNLPGPVFNPVGPIGREMSQDKPPRNTAPLGKAPSRGEQNDYSQNFVDTGMRPQNFIRELELTNVVEDYPKLRELIQRKDEIVANSSFPPMYYKCDLKEHALSSEFFGTKFDVILVDPPWEEYVHRAPGVTDHLEYWSVEEIQNLKIEAIADTPSFIFLWVGDGVGLEQGRQCLKKWGFRRCEDICWVKTNKKNAAPGLRHDSHTLLQHSKEHCLMGIKGTVRRSTDGHIIHANIDTDIIIAEEPTDGSTKKPDDMYRIIEHFALGRRRLELFGEDHNIRSGWLTVGKGLSSSNYSSQSYIRNFADKEGKVWQGGGGRNPPPEAPHLVVTTPEIEGLRPKSPPSKSQQQQQQQSMPLMTAGNSMNRRASGNSPQTSNAASFSGMNPDPSGSEAINLLQWASPSLGRGPESGRNEYGYGFNPSGGQNIGDHIEFDLYRTPNRNLM